MAGFLQVLFLGLAPSAGCQAASANNSSFAVIDFSLITSVDSRVAVLIISPCRNWSGPSETPCIRSTHFQNHHHDDSCAAVFSPCRWGRWLGVFRYRVSGGPGGIRTRVHDAFTWKGSQQFFLLYYLLRDLSRQIGHRSWSIQFLQSAPRFFGGVCTDPHPAFLCARSGFPDHSFPKFHIQNLIIVANTEIGRDIFQPCALSNAGMATMSIWRVTSYPTRKLRTKVD